MAKISIEEVNNLVQYLHNNNYIHRKRGYELGKASPTMAGVHLIEEAAEYVAACICPEGMKLDDQMKPKISLQLEESADVLACWLHLNYLMELPLDIVANKALEKLQDIFVLPTDP